MLHAVDFSLKSLKFLTYLIYCVPNKNYNNYYVQYITDGVYNLVHIESFTALLATNGHVAAIKRHVCMTDPEL